MVIPSFSILFQTYSKNCLINSGKSLWQIIEKAKVYRVSSNEINISSKFKSLIRLNQSKSMDWFLDDRDLRRERVKCLPN